MRRSGFWKMHLLCGLVALCPFAIFASTPLMADPIVSWYVETAGTGGDPTCAVPATVSLSLTVDISSGTLMTAQFYNPGCITYYPTIAPEGTPFEGYYGTNPISYGYSPNINFPPITSISATSSSETARYQIYSYLLQMSGTIQITWPLGDTGILHEIPTLISFDLPVAEYGVWGPDDGSGDFPIDLRGAEAVYPVRETPTLAMWAGGIFLLVGLGWRRRWISGAPQSA